MPGWQPPGWQRRRQQERPRAAAAAGEGQRGKGRARGHPRQRQEGEHGCLLFLPPPGLSRCFPLSPSNQAARLGESKVNNPLCSDVKFLVEGREFFAHRIALIDQSDYFHTLFAGPFADAKKDNWTFELPEASRPPFLLSVCCCCAAACKGCGSSGSGHRS